MNIMNIKKWEKVKTKSLLFFILGIVGISISLLFSSCGSGPALKTLLSNLGVYAVDFDKVPNPWPADASVVIGIDGLRYTAIKDHTSGRATSKVIGDIDGNDYYCIKNHKAGDNNERPTSGANWATYWAATGTTGQGATWVSGRYYYTRDNEPPWGPNWQTYWVQQGSGGVAWAASRLYYIGDVGAVGLGKSIPRLADMEEFTIEAWVKSTISTPASILQGGIFSRADDNYGCVLFVSDDAKFTVKPRATTSAAYLVSSGVTLDNSTGWTHVAGVFVNEDHSAVHASCTGSVGSGTSITTDSNDNLYISYYDGDNKDLKYATNASGSWEIARLSTYGGGSSIAIDSSNNVHISYYDGTSQAARDLRYATCAGGSNCTQNSSPPPGWSDILVDGWGQSGGPSSLVIDSTGKLHIAFYLAELKDCPPDEDVFLSSGDLMYATCDPATAPNNCTVQADWTRITIEDGAHIIITVSGTQYIEYLGESPSIAIDSSDNLHISYAKVTRNRYGSPPPTVSADLKYATCSSGCTTPASWVKTTVHSDGQDITGIVGTQTSIAIDSSDNLHISYLDSDNQDLMYATTRGVTSGNGNCTDTDWDCTMVDGTGLTAGWGTSLAIDSSNNLHISYWTGPSWWGGSTGTNNLKYATCDPATAPNNCTVQADWTPNITTLDSAGNVGQSPSLAIDSSNDLHISYYDATNGNLKYATYVGAGGTGCDTAAWTCTTLDDGDASGDTPHIDIYVNGEFKACRAAISLGPADETTSLCGGVGSEPISAESNEQIGRSQIAWSDMNISAGTRLEGVIDEVRFWREARTAGQIKTWMYKEITVGNWNQANPNNALIGYWKFNEGSGAAIHDFSGSQNAGSKSYCEFFDRNGDGDVEDVVYSDAPANTIVDCYQSDVNCGGKTGVCSSVLWEGGWVAGYPF